MLDLYGSLTIEVLIVIRKVTAVSLNVRINFNFVYSAFFLLYSLFVIVLTKKAAISWERIFCNYYKDFRPISLLFSAYKTVKIPCMLDMQTFFFNGLVCYLS